jgi:hypothetical protein
MQARSARQTALVLAILATGTFGGSLGASPPPCERAFDGAEGAGACSAGGRGGRIIEVTTLADDGPGSLRAAVEAEGPRIVHFRVAGTIRLTRDLTIRHPRITIDGRSAPAQGVAVADHSLVVNADDVIIRYFRSRLGDQGGSEGDAIWLAGGRRIILDHVSASWSVDETLSASARYHADRDDGLYDVTVQWSIIAESLRRANHPKGEHGYGSLIRGGRGARFSFHHNIWAHHVARMPRPGNYSPVAEDPLGPVIEFRSNLFYNWGGSASGYNADRDSAATYAFVDNCYLPGPDSRGRMIFREENPHARSWFAGNSMDGVIPADQHALVQGLWNPLASAPSMPAVAADPATGGCVRLLDEAGASQPRDAVDTRVIADIRARRGRIIDSQADVGGWPALDQPAAPATQH